MTTPPLPEPTEAGPDLAFSPRTILGGFVLIATVILLLFRRRRAGKASDR